MKIVIIPDSFKGSIDAERAADIIDAAAKKHFPDGQILKMPMGDGGEGTLSCIHGSIGGTVEETQVKGPFGQPQTAKWIFDESSGTAFVESAEVVGLPKVAGMENPETSTTAGIGQIIKSARDRGAKKIIAAIGGTCTNDCGAGMLAEMGVRFLDKHGKAFVPVGATLGDVIKIELTEDFDKFRDVEFEVMCDVKNPLCGPMGCAAVFGPQKGADPEMVRRLDDGARRFAAVTAETFGCDMSEAAGAGAAGGLGFGFAAFLNGKLRRGADVILDIYGFDREISDAELIITGEGSFDWQSLMGKAVGCVIQRADGLPVAVFCGKRGSAELPDSVEVIEISCGMPLTLAIKHAEENLKICAERYFAAYAEKKQS